MVEPKQKPAGKPFHTADKARIPRTAMRAAWLRTREGTRRLTAEEQQDGHYREAASLEECAVDTAVLGGGGCRRGHPARRQKGGATSRAKATDGKSNWSGRTSGRAGNGCSNSADDLYAG